MSADVFADERPPWDGPDGDPDMAVEAQLAFNRDVHEEAHRLRVREAARDLIARERTQPAPPFDAGSLREMLARPPAPPMRIDGLQPWESGLLVSAARKTGKTTLELNYARALLTGEPFLGRFEVIPLDGNVAILNYEVSGEILSRWAHEAGIDHDRLHLVNLRGRRNPLAHVDDREQLAGWLRSRDVESLVVDPFGRAYTGQSQNDPGEVGAWLIDLDVFVRSEVGARDLLLTAHAGWNGERTRGSSALEDWGDSLVWLTRDPEDDTKRYLKAEGRGVMVDEDRLNYDGTTRTLTMSGAGSRRKAKGDRRLDELVHHVAELIRLNAGWNTSDVRRGLKAAGIGHQKGDESKALRLAVDRGLLRSEIGERGSIRYFPSTPTPTYPDVPHPGHVPPTPTPPIDGGVGGEGRSSATYPASPHCLECSRTSGHRANCSQREAS